MVMLDPFGGTGALVPPEYESALLLMGLLCGDYSDCLG
jgi:hypothetical protein